MAAIVNERDVLLQATVPRYTVPTDRQVLLSATSKVFHVPVSGVGAPSTITLTASLLNMVGTVTWSTSPATTLTGSGNSRTLAFADMGAVPVQITASYTLDGVTYQAHETVTKVLDGVAGATGLQNSLIYAYQRAAVAPALKPGDITWTFASATITTPATDALLNGWTKTIPAGTNPLYVTLCSASGNGATDTIANAEWASPVLFTENGLNSATVYIYQRTASATAPTLPSATTTYTFATGGLTGLNNGWSRTIPAASGGAYLHVSTATALSVSATDTIPSSEWAASQLLSTDGVDGIDADGLVLTSTAQAFTYDGEGAATPTSQTISFTANLKGAVAGTAAFTCTRYNDAGSALGSVTMGGAGTNTRTLTIAQFNTNAAYAVVTATEDGYSDTITVVRLQAGTDALTGYLTNESHTVPASDVGVVSSYSGASGTFKVWLGTDDVTDECTFSVVGSPLVTTTAPTAITGAYAVTASGTWTNVSNTTTVTYRATRSGRTIDKVLTLTKSISGTPGADGDEGVRGSRHFYASPYSVWNSSAATTTASVDGGPILADVVTQSDSSVGFSQTRAWNGSSWIVVTQVIDGNLLVDGTVLADSFVAASFIGYTITGSILRTAASPDERIELNNVSNSMVVYDDDNVARVRISATEFGGSIWSYNSSIERAAIYGKSDSAFVAIRGENTAASSIAVAVSGDAIGVGIGGGTSGSGGIAVRGISTHASGYGAKFSNTAAGTALWVIGPSLMRTITPEANNTYALGSAVLAYANIYCQVALTVTSDARQKLQVKDSDLGLKFVLSLRPVSYRLRKGKRRHYGFIAQEVRDALGKRNAGIWTLADPTDPESAQALRYEELIAPMVRAIQQLSDRLELLEQLERKLCPTI